jgi:hypothetical protein
VLPQLPAPIEQDKPAKRLRPDPLHVILRINDSQQPASQFHPSLPVQESRSKIQSSSSLGAAMTLTEPTQTSSIIIRGAASRKSHQEDQPSSTGVAVQGHTEGLSQPNTQHGKISIIARLSGLDLRLDGQPTGSSSKGTQLHAQKSSDLSIRGRATLSSSLNNNLGSTGNLSNQRGNSQSSMTSTPSRVPLMDRIHGVKAKARSEQTTPSQTIFDRVGVTKGDTINLRPSSSTSWKPKNG